MQKAKSNKHYDWAIMPDLYIATALLLLEQIIPDIPNKVDFSSNVIEGIGLRSHHPNYELILPLVFNFKHGIELYIKTLGIIDCGAYQKIHDFKELFEELKKVAKGTENEATIKQLHNDTWCIIKKYYYGRYVPSNHKSKFADKQNESERYPEYKSREKYGKIYKIPERHEWVTRGVLEEIEKDIRIIEQKFAQAKRDIKPTKEFIYGKTSKP